MKQRKIYEAPAMEVVEMELQGSLLATSGNQELESDSDLGDVNWYGGSMYD